MGWEKENAVAGGTRSTGTREIPITSIGHNWEEISEVCCLKKQWVVTLTCSLHCLHCLSVTELRSSRENNKGRKWLSEIGAINIRNVRRNKRLESASDSEDQDGPRSPAEDWPPLGRRQAKSRSTTVGLNHLAIASDWKNAKSDKGTWRDGH